jgi:hypothetical protein
VRELVVVSVLLCVTVAVTWPLSDRLFSRFYDHSDPPGSAWGLWWAKERLFSFQDPWTAPDIFAPRGTMLAFSAYVPLAGIVLSPLTALVGPAVVLNLTKLALPTALSYAVYRLGLRIGLPSLIALIAGVLYGCSALLVYRVDVHLNFAVGALLPPLTLLFALRYRQAWRLREAAAAGAVVGAGMLIDPTSVIFAVVTGGSFAIALAVRGDRATRTRLGRGLVVAAVAALVFASPQLIAMKRQLDAGEFSVDTQTLAGSWVIYGQTIESLVTPSPTFRLIEPARRLGDSQRAGEGFPTYGWGLLFLLSTGFVLAARRALVKWLGLLWLIATLVALGPTLRLAGSTFAPAPIERYGYELSGLMPYTWLVQLPGFADQRVAARYIMLALLPAALLAGFGVRALAKKGRWGRVSLSVALLLCALDLGSPMSFEGEIKQPSLYRPIRADRSRSIVVDVPLAWVTATRFLGTLTNAQALLRATEHRHPIAYGFVTRANVDLLFDLAKNRFYTDLMILQGGALLGAVPVPGSVDVAAGRRNARELGVGWAVVQPNAAPAVANYLNATGFHLVREHRGIRLFRAPFGHGGSATTRSRGAVQRIVRVR